MNYEELIALYRLLSDDAVDSDDTGNTFLQDSGVRLFLKEAEDEAAVRGRLIHESEDASVCQISVTSGTSTYAIDPILYELTHVSFVDTGSARHQVKLVSTEALDTSPDDVITSPVGDDYDIDVSCEDWRDSTGTPPLYAIQTDRYIRLVPRPTADGTLHLEGYRVSSSNARKGPEIATAHHAYLVQWVLFRVFSNPDYDTGDGRRAAVALAEFERYFGLNPGSDIRRQARIDTPHHVNPHFV